MLFDQELGECIRISYDASQDIKHAEARRAVAVVRIVTAPGEAWRDPHDFHVCVGDGDPPRAMQIEKYLEETKVNVTANGSTRQISAADYLRRKDVNVFQALEMCYRPVMFPNVTAAGIKQTQARIAGQVAVLIAVQLHLLQEGRPETLHSQLAAAAPNGEIPAVLLDKLLPIVQHDQGSVWHSCKPSNGGPLSTRLFAIKLATQQPRCDAMRTVAAVVKAYCADPSKRGTNGITTAIKSVCGKDIALQNLLKAKDGEQQAKQAELQAAQTKLAAVEAQLAEARQQPSTEQTPWHQQQVTSRADGDAQLHSMMAPADSALVPEDVAAEGYAAGGVLPDPPSATLATCRAAAGGLGAPGRGHAEHAQRSIAVSGRAHAAGHGAAGGGGSLRSYGSRQRSSRGRRHGAGRAATAPEATDTMQQQHEAQDDAAGNDGTAGTSRDDAALAVAAGDAVGQPQQQQQQQQQQVEQDDPADGSAGDVAAGEAVRGAAAGTASQGEQEPQDADASQQQLFTTLLGLSQCTSVLSLGCLSVLGAEGTQRLWPAPASAAGEARARQLWEPFIAAVQSFVKEGRQLATEVQLLQQACVVVGIQQLSDDAEACSAAMQLLQSMRRLGTAVADMQRGSVAEPSGSGLQFNAAALSSRMIEGCREMHAALVSHTAELLQLDTAAMPLPAEARERVQAGAWRQLYATATRCL
ncbi:hypothetical protein OEZ85_013531 [Tetradesmus obliquus]|uniref:Uncharacterized protein n=1 Tax=Tetradesmus obliquus TaxID=3088 RepID=A0ABY8UUB4_TETOB|nr:hypothetical protein OEZ85_013531 [Tetradesmus obliquus]